MELKPITVADIPSDYLSRGKSILKLSEAEWMVKVSTKLYSMSGKEDYGILGLIQPTMLSREAAIWLLWYRDSKHCLSDWRKAKNLLTELSSELKLTFWADVQVGDPMSLKFAKHFGLTEVDRIDDFIILKGAA